MIKRVAVLLLVFVLSSCSPTPDTEPVAVDFKTQIRWTSYGIPHVKADNWAGLGYGFAYATAADGICVIAHSLMTGNGELSQFNPSIFVDAN